MATPNEAAIYQKLGALLGGRLDFDDFWDWLRPLQRTIPASDPARKLLFSIIAKLDEYDSSEMTDGHLKDYLSALLPAPAAIQGRVYTWAQLRADVGISQSSNTPPIHSTGFGQAEVSHRRTETGSYLAGKSLQAAYE